MLISCWPTTPKKLQLNTGNRQDWVFIHPAGISDSTFQLLIYNIWFCKLHLLFTFETKTDAGMKKHARDFVTVLEEYNGYRRPGMHILHIMHIMIQIYHILHILHILRILHVMI